MPNRHFLRSDIFTVAMVYFFIFVCFLLNEIVNMFAKRNEIKYYFSMYLYQ